MKVGSVGKKSDWNLIVKVEQVDEGSGSRKVEVDLQISNHISIVKVDQVQEASKFVKVGADL